MVTLINRIKRALADNLKSANPPKHDLVPCNHGFYVSCLDDNLISSAVMVESSRVRCVPFIHHRR